MKDLRRSVSLFDDTYCAQRNELSGSRSEHDVFEITYPAAFFLVVADDDVIFVVILLVIAGICSVKAFTHCKGGHSRVDSETREFDSVEFDGDFRFAAVDCRFNILKVRLFFKHFLELVACFGKFFEVVAFDLDLDRLA